MSYFIFQIFFAMKNFSFTSFLSITALALAWLILSGIGSKTFAYTGNYLEFTPNGCTSMNVAPVEPSDFVWLFDVDPNTIYVLTGGTYVLTQNVDMENCSVFIVNGDATSNAIFDFQGGKSFTNNGWKQSFTIRGFDSGHRLKITGATSPGAILLQNSSWATISYTTLSGFTVLWWIAFDHTTNSTISNNIITNNKDGIRLMWWSHNNIVTNNIINNNTEYGILFDWVSWCIASNNTMNHNNYWIYFNITSNSTIANNTVISGSTTMWIYIKHGQHNSITNNTITNNTIWMALDTTDANTFTNNTINSNAVYWLSIGYTSSGNVFNGDTISSNATTNVYIFNSSQYNQFISTNIQSSAIGIQMDSSNYNTFSGVNVANNTSGTKLSLSSNNTLKLTNNTNGIWLYGWSNNNTILNTQILGQNNISIINGSNNVIMGWLFSATSTTSTSVNINLKNGWTTTVNYTLGWAWLSGAYIWTLWASSTLSLPITLTVGNGAKDILVTYNSGNKQYDTITLWSASPNGWNSWGGGWGGGWGLTPTCTSAQLVCINGIRALATWSICQWGNLAHACTIGSWWTWTLPVGSIVGSTYSTELNNAYLWAYAHGITTMATIQKAKMWGILIRSHMAKMISNFAITLGGLTPDTNKTCTFDDIANQNAELKFYIKISCQLGLMGIDIDNFDPNGQVTRAQFGTILSRVIWGNTYEWGIKYYTNHLNALKLAGIMTQISNPTMKELRGYVMLMMKRTYEWGFLHN